MDWTLFQKALISSVVFSLVGMAVFGLGFVMLRKLLPMDMKKEIETDQNTALGIGAWLSRFIDKGVAQRFVEIELMVALAGGVSAPFLFFTFSEGAAFRIALYGTVTLVGTLVGLEIPLLMRIMKDELNFKDLISRVLTFDYIGALLASLLFPLVLVPRLGLVRTSLLFGMLNALIGVWSTWLLSPLLSNPMRLRIKGAFCTLLLLTGFVFGDHMTSFFEEHLFQDEVVHAQSTPYQRIVVTHSHRRCRRRRTARGC